MAEALAYLHERFLPQSQAALPLHDAGFVLGATVTDLCRTFRHRLYRWDDHLARFRRSCRSAEIHIPLGDADIKARAEELVAHNAKLLNPEHDLALVMFATPGPVGYYLGEAGGAGSGPVTFGMHTFPLPFARYRPLIERGATLVIPRTRHVPAACIDPRIKQRSRLHWWLADREAHAIEPGAIALLLAVDGQLTETAAANFLLVQQDTVVSPPAERVLDGISLKVVRELCRQLGIPFVHRPIYPADLRTAQEALLTSTTFCLAGVCRCQDHVIPWPGPVQERLVKAWSNEVGLDIRAQILAGS